MVVQHPADPGKRNRPRIRYTSCDTTGSGVRPGNGTPFSTHRTQSSLLSGPPAQAAGFAESACGKQRITAGRTIRRRLAAH